MTDPREIGPSPWTRLGTGSRRPAPSLASDELTAAMAHEISQPLAAIMIDGESCLRWLGRAEPRLDEARESVAAMIRNAQRSSNIIRNLLALCTPANLASERLDVNEVVAEGISLIEPDILRHEVVVRLDLDTELPSVLGNRIQLQQVIVNLLRNSIRAMEPVDDREMLIRSGLDSNEQVIVTVEDNGTGIDPRRFDRLFDAFFTTGADGMGMGLAICRLIVEAHGGRIWASRNIERGAAFHFALPAGRAASPS